MVFRRKREEGVSLTPHVKSLDSRSSRGTMLAQSSVQSIAGWLTRKSTVRTLGFFGSQQTNFPPISEAGQITRKCQPRCFNTCNTLSPAKSFKSNSLTRRRSFFSEKGMGQRSKLAEVDTGRTSVSSCSMCGSKVGGLRKKVYWRLPTHWTLSTPSIRWFLQLMKSSNL